MRLIVVSNRLPINISYVDGEPTLNYSVGGLATGLLSFVEKQIKEDPSFSYSWVGWPGNVQIDDEMMRKNTLGPEYIPVTLSEMEMEKFYEGFCNKTIWPLFHYFPMYTSFDDSYWEEYIHVNLRFCEKVAEIVKPGDLLFINDYHLFLLPEMLRKVIPEVKIAFFLHIPFPQYEIFRLLPSIWRKKILEGILGSDLIGFHTHEYAQYFLRSVLRILGFEHTLGEILMNSHLVKVDTFPMGIDFEKYNSYKSKIAPSASLPQSEKENIRTILSIDRLDYTKGILNRLKGYELFLNTNPDYHGKICMHVIAVPSRIGVDKYQNLKKELDEYVGKINGNLSKPGWIPIFYQFTTLGLGDLIEVYRACDIALVTPLRDGMNLIAKEYLAARNDATGVLILSETAGAAKELYNAILINPNSASEISNAITEALSIDTREQIKRNTPVRENLKVLSVVNWVEDIIQGVSIVTRKRNKFRERFITENIEERIRSQYTAASSRIFFLDYDGTLVGFSKHPGDVLPDKIILHLLSRLCQKTNTTVYIVSGRNRNFLAQCFTDKRLGIIAEHGAFIRYPEGLDWFSPVPLDNNWFEQILPIFEYYEKRVLGSFIEKKECSLVWHYRSAIGDQELIRERSLELFDELTYLMANIDVQVVQGNKIIEVRKNGINKGAAVKSVLELAISDFVMAIGDDSTDEDMFRVLPPSAITIKVGYGSSHARYSLISHDDVISLLEKIVEKD